MVTCGCVVKVEPIAFAEGLDMRLRKERKQRMILRFGGELGYTPGIGVEQGVCVCVLSPV